MTFKVIQITDTHLFKDPKQKQKGVNTYRTLVSVVRDITENQAGFDAVLLTGDLSQDETPESYDLLKELLAPIRDAPFHAIPGNHDNLNHMQSRLAGDGFAVLSDLCLGKWRIAMLDSQVPGRVHGEIGADQRQRLARTLEEGWEHVMVALHHPPIMINTAWLDASRCVDGETLLAVAAKPPVKAFVCGHVHQEFDSTVNGVAILTTPSTCVQFKPGSDDFAIDSAAPGYRMFELEDDGRWTTTVRRVDVGQNSS